MNRTMFSGPSKIDIGGISPIQFIGLYSGYSEYRVSGFVKKEVNLFDYRSIHVKLVTKYVFVEPKRYLFLKRFCIPSFVTINKYADNKINLELRDLQNQEIKHFLWIAIGTNEVPIYSYEIIINEDLDRSVYGDTIALCSVIKL